MFFSNHDEISKNGTISEQPLLSNSPSVSLWPVAAIIITFGGRIFLISIAKMILDRNVSPMLFVARRPANTTMEISKFSLALRVASTGLIAESAVID